MADDFDMAAFMGAPPSQAGSVMGRSDDATNTEQGSDGGGSVRSTTSTVASRALDMDDLEADDSMAIIAKGTFKSLVNKLYARQKKSSDQQLTLRMFYRVLDEKFDELGDNEGFTYDPSFIEREKNDVAELKLVSIKDCLRIVANALLEEQEVRDRKLRGEDMVQEQTEQAANAEESPGKRKKNVEQADELVSEPGGHFSCQNKDIVSLRTTEYFKFKLGMNTTAVHQQYGHPDVTEFVWADLNPKERLAAVSYLLFGLTFILLIAGLGSIGTEHLARDQNVTAVLTGHHMEAMGAAMVVSVNKQHQTLAHQTARNLANVVDRHSSSFRTKELTDHLSHVSSVMAVGVEKLVTRTVEAEHTEMGSLMTPLELGDRYLLLTAFKRLLSHWVWKPVEVLPVVPCAGSAGQPKLQSHKVATITTLLSPTSGATNAIEFSVSTYNRTSDIQASPCDHLAYPSPSTNPDSPVSTSMALALAAGGTKCGLVSVSRNGTSVLWYRCLLVLKQPQVLSGSSKVVCLATRRAGIDIVNRVHSVLMASGSKMLQSTSPASVLEDMRNVAVVMSYPDISADTLSSIIHQPPRTTQSSAGCGGLLSPPNSNITAVDGANNLTSLLASPPVGSRELVMPLVTLLSNRTAHTASTSTGIFTSGGGIINLVGNVTVYNRRAFAWGHLGVAVSVNSLDHLRAVLQPSFFPIVSTSSQLLGARVALSYIDTQLKEVTVVNPIDQEEHVDLRQQQMNRSSRGLYSFTKVNHRIFPHFALAAQGHSGSVSSPTLRTAEGAVGYASVKSAKIGVIVEFDSTVLRRASMKLICKVMDEHLTRLQSSEESVTARVVGIHFLRFAQGGRLQRICKSPMPSRDEQDLAISTLTWKRSSLVRYKPREEIRGDSTVLAYDVKEGVPERFTYSSYVPALDATVVVTAEATGRARRNTYWIGVGVVALLCPLFFAYQHIFVGYILDRVESEYAIYKTSMSDEKHRFIQLVEDMVPPYLLSRTAGGERMIFEHQPILTFIFADLCGTGDIFNTMGKKGFVTIIGYIFMMQDGIANYYSIFKVKTIGDGYFGVAGLPETEDQTTKQASSVQVYCAFSFATVLQQLLSGKYIHYPERTKCFQQYSEAPDDKHFVQLPQLDVKIGIHTGAAYTGILYAGRAPQFDCYGRAVSLAAAMEKTAGKGRVQTTHPTKALLAEVDVEKMFKFEKAQKKLIKMHSFDGAMSTYTLKESRLALPNDISTWLKVDPVLSVVRHTDTKGHATSKDAAGQEERFEDDDLVSVGAPSMMDEVSDRNSGSGRDFNLEESVRDDNSKASSGRSRQSNDNTQGIDSKAEPSVPSSQKSHPRTANSQLQAPPARADPVDLSSYRSQAKPTLELPPALPQAPPSLPSTMLAPSTTLPNQLVSPLRASPDPAGGRRGSGLPPASMLTAPPVLPSASPVIDLGGFDFGLAPPPPIPPPPSF